MTDTAVPPPPAPANEDKTVAILAYITLIGFIIAIIMHSSKKTQLGAYHLRQALGLFITAIVAWIAIMICAFILIWIPIVGPLLAGLLWFVLGIGLLALAIMGLIAAVNGQMKPLPVVGEMYQKWFGGAFV
jgi:uncharacterized membrane protein